MAISGAGGRARAKKPTPAPPKTRLKGAERRARFLQAAASIIIEQGVSSVTMEEVAARTDVDKRLGYKYFANREALLHALFEQEMAEATRRAALEISPQSDLRAIIHVYIRVWLELNTEHGPLLSRLFSDQQIIPAVAQEIGDRAVRDWAAAFSGQLNLSTTRAGILSRIYLCGLRGAVESLKAHAAPLEDITEIYATALYAGAQAVVALPEIASEARSGNESASKA